MNTRKLTTGQFIERSKQVHGSRFTYARTVYRNSKTPVIITCRQHGDVSVNPNNHIHAKSGCSHCYGRMKKTTEQFTKQVEGKHSNCFTFEKTKYINDNTKVIITCKQHGDFTPLPTNVLQGSGCPQCALDHSSLTKRKSLLLFIEEANAVHGGVYDYSKAEYKNNTTPVEIICPKHGMFRQKPIIHVDQKCGCKKCVSTIGEKAVRKWLSSKEISFEEQKKFEGCRYKRLLSYDFYLPDYKTLIEYNGIQHYRPIPAFHNKTTSHDTFEAVLKRDEIKRQYAKKKGLRLIIVPYNEKVEDVLGQHLTVRVLPEQKF